MPLFTGSDRLLRFRVKEWEICHLHRLVNPDIIRKAVPTKLILRDGQIGIDVKWSILGKQVSISDKKWQVWLPSPQSLTQVNWKNRGCVMCQVELKTEETNGTNPPLSQMPQGAVLVFAVSEPFDCSNPQKKRVLLGCPTRSTSIFPAKLLPKAKLMLGRG